MAAPHQKLPAIQVGRAIAAIMVVAYHANDFVLPLRLYDGRIAWRGFGMGYVGVEFFFVLLLGNASYAIYLVHLPAMNLFAIIFAGMGVQHVLPPLVMFGLLSAIAVLTGTVFHLVVERPLLARLAGPRRRVGLQAGRQ